MEENEIEIQNACSCAEEDIDLDSVCSEEACLLDRIVHIDIDSFTDSEDFKRGLADTAYLCGQITALVNIGVNPHKAFDYFAEKEMNKIVMEHNLKVSEIQKESAIETAKLSYVSRTAEMLSM